MIKYGGKFVRKLSPTFKLGKIKWK